MRRISALLIPISAAITIEVAAAAVAFVPGYEVAPEYPERALRMEVQGDVKVQCVLRNDGQFTKCTLRSETPEDFGFGRAALGAAERARIDIEASGLEGRVGKSLILPIAFRLEDLPSGESEPAGLDVFAEGAALEPEDRAARQVSPNAPPGSACPDGQDCGVAY